MAQKIYVWCMQVHIILQNSIDLSLMIMINKTNKIIGKKLTDKNLKNFLNCQEKLVRLKFLS